jgi:hypothetical protein
VRRRAARVLRATLPHIAIACVLAGCALFSRSPAAPEGRAPVVLDPGSPVELRDGHNRPRLSLVRREGDPEAGVALAVAHDLGSVASVALAELVALRLRSTQHEADALAFGTGFAVRSLARDASSAARFVTASRDALLAPPDRAELEHVNRRLRSVGMEHWTDGAAEAVGRCSGELGSLSATRREAITVGGLTSWLERVRSAESVAYAAVGPHALLEAAAEALEAAGEWPATGGAEDPWPDADAFSASSGAVATGMVTVAVHVPDGARALAAARTLPRSDSALSQRIAHLEPGWSLDAVLATTRVRGACLRVDLRAARGSEPPTARVAAGVAALVVDEVLREAVHGSATPWDLDEGILRASDPREAASVAAWRALSGQLPAGRPRRFVSYRVSGPHDRPGVRAEFERAVRQALARPIEPTFEVHTRVEAGQGELWLLLANPCGTRDETRADAGVRALALRALTGVAARQAAVTLEPWVTPDGIGLLAHGPRASGDESPTAHAERLAAALARAVVATRLDETAIATERSRLLADLDPDRDALTAAAFEALVPGRPSWLDPRGGWQPLVALTAGAVHTEARRFPAEPLRLAVIANHDDAQASVAARELARWLHPGRLQDVPCAPQQAPQAQPGRYTIETRRASGAAARALVGVRLPADAARRTTEAEWTVFLMNRSGGWLDRSLKVPGVASQAHASLLGGAAASALVIEVAALTPDAEEAVAQVRALLARLARGAATAADFTASEQAFAAATRRTAFDPRRRIVDLWRGARSGPPPTLETLRKFHAAALGDAGHVVVVERPRP